MPIDWKEARKDYETSGLDERGVCRKYKCKIETLKRRAKKEGWKKPLKGPAEKKEAEARWGEELIDDKRVLKRIRRKLYMGLENSDIEELKVAKMAHEVLASMKQAWGRHEGEEPDLTDEIVRQMEEATVSPGAEQAVD